MEDTTKIDYLQDLKQKIINTVTPLLRDDDLEPEERFDFYYTIASTNSSQESLELAFDAAQKIVSTERKAASLMQLLELVAIIQDDVYEVEETDKIENNKDQQVSNNIKSTSDTVS